MGSGGGRKKQRRESGGRARGRGASTGRRGMRRAASNRRRTGDDAEEEEEEEEGEAASGDTSASSSDMAPSLGVSSGTGSSGGHAHQPEMRSSRRGTRGALPPVTARTKQRFAASRAQVAGAPEGAGVGVSAEKMARTCLSFFCLNRGVCMTSIRFVLTPTLVFLLVAVWIAVTCMDCGKLCVWSSKKWRTCASMRQ
ncbi:hypothetical protein Vretifemale_7970 [Volvox reticuliferus]|uniref:Uncharacterized protein n=1 Tax=Volvox reticuliferus TaxID=1737510 RepID=A0A8J4C9Q3_9CHLO|nr:hypothetical protein Vretifemale_7970 [Volvox reticuliferus]